MENLARREAVLKSVAAALLVTLATDAGSMPLVQALRDLAAAAQDTLPDITAEEILESVTAIAAELQKRAIRQLH